MQRCLYRGLGRSLTVRLAMLLPLTWLHNAPSWSEETRGTHAAAEAHSTAIRQVDFQTLSPPLDPAAFSDAAQIRIDVQVLSVDETVRDAIYALLDPAQIESVTTPIPSNQDSASGQTSATTCTDIVAVGGRMSVCVLDDQLVAQAIKLTTEAAASELLMAPQMVLFDGRQAAIEDFVQRPFVVDIQPSIKDGQTDLEPVIQVLDEGMQVQVTAELTGAPASQDDMIKLKVRFADKRIVDVTSQQVYGLGPEPRTVQVPMQRIKTAVAEKRIALGQSLLMDPYLVRVVEARQERGVPMFNKIPYLNRTFRNVSVARSEQHVLLLVRPSLEPTSPTS